MAFPQVQATAISGSSPNQTLHVVTLPSGIVSGQTLFVLHNCQVEGTFPAGWTIFHTANEPTGPHNVQFAYRLADGTEGASITVTNPGPISWAAQAFRISGATDPTVTPPEGASVGGTPSSPNADPPALSPAGGSKDYLWFAAYGSSSAGSQGAAPTTPGFGNSLISGNASSDSETVRSETTAATLNPSPAWTSPDNFHIAATIAIHPGPPTTVALSGSITDDTELDIRNGIGSTIILALTNDTWVAAGGTFNAQRQNIIDGIDSAQSEANGWDAVARPAIPVGNVVRTNATTVTITMPAVPGYNITANETVEATVPASALVTSGIAVIATPTFGITSLIESAALSGTVTDDTEQDIRNGGSTIILTLTNAQWEADVGADNAQTQALIDGIDSAQAEPTGWDAVVKAGLTFADVARTNNTVVTITLPAFPTYDITGDETVTVIIPASALDFPDALTASPTFSINDLPLDAPALFASVTLAQQKVLLL